MGLKFKVENIEEVAEAQREFYTERDGAYYLDIEGMPSSKTDDDVKTTKPQGKNSRHLKISALRKSYAKKLMNTTLSKTAAERQTKNFWTTRSV